MSRPVDITGQRFGRLIVRERAGALRGKAAWLCECDCGTRKVCVGTELRVGHVVSCGCRQREARRQPINLAGQRFGRLTAIEPVGKGNDNGLVWRCVCDCGTEAAVASVELRRGKSQSCGCRGREQVAALGRAALRHGHTVSGWSPTYRSWQAMIQRCSNPNATKYSHYGGRGITVCEPWAESFERFLEDVGERPEGMTLDRIDNDGNYEPGNVRWATHKQQAHNRRPRSKVAVGAALAVLAAMVGAVAVAAPAYAAEPDTIGATIESRVYMDERPTMLVMSRSTVPATLAFEATGGWRVEPASLTLDPEQEAEVTIVGSGEDGATINVRVMPADPEPGMLSGVALLSSRVYYERPFDPLPFILAAAALFVVALLLSVRLALRHPRTG